ncbi:MAG: hypothetical protein M1813_003471 [Trichoglossum hirsutum]|nr:MAG: hypothetical protein M1813_003471 [Trichoglossum hirsutum]
MRALVALLYLIIAAGPTIALPIADPAIDDAKSCDEHDMSKRDLLLRDPGNRFGSLDKRESVKRPHGGLAIDFKRETQPTVEDCDPEIEARDQGVRHNLITKREVSWTGATHKRSAEPEPMDDCDSEVETRSPDNHYGGVTKRPPKQNRLGSLGKARITLVGSLGGVRKLRRG